jgi:hypothetical protein
MAQRNPRGTKLPSRSETARAHGVLLEQLGSQMNVVLEAAIQKNSEDLRRHSAEIRSLRDEVAGLRHDFDHRQELGRVDALEVRVSAIESRLGVLSR